MPVGSCLCQQARFEVEGDNAAFYLCHCTYCQKDTGSAHAVDLFVPDGKIRWIAGADHVKTYNLPGTRHCKRFCGH